VLHAAFRHGSRGSRLPPDAAARAEHPLRRPRPEQHERARRRPTAQPRPTAPSVRPSQSLRQRRLSGLRTGIGRCRRLPQPGLQGAVVAPGPPGSTAPLSTEDVVALYRERGCTSS
jgi:hypothetical protein